jgi:hypothetical protein
MRDSTGGWNELIICSGRNDCREGKTPLLAELKLKDP